MPASQILTVYMYYKKVNAYRVHIDRQVDTQTWRLLVATSPKLDSGTLKSFRAATCTSMPLI